jgi:DNA-directed RNA polymerase subunit RPC12/RpoP
LDWDKRNKARTKLSRKRKLEADRLRMAEIKANTPKACNYCKQPFVGEGRTCQACAANLEMQQKFRTVAAYRCGECGSKVIEKPCRACEMRALAKRVKA